MDQRSVLIKLHEMDRIGWKTIALLMEKRVNLADLLLFSELEWRELGFSPDKAKKISSELTMDQIEHTNGLLLEQGIHVVTFLDEQYPILMKETARPPWVLYGLGRMELLSSLSVAIVGTRVPTAYGRKVSVMLSEALSEAGITVVSGMARGIDSICHETVLDYGGSTIAVLGTGIDVIYPPENTSLYHFIAERGLVLSEYPIGTKSHPGLFPQRNRIIAGMTRGTVVVEADERSGSLITADAALEANRDVFAVPGPITSPKSRGTLSLIKQGAKVVTSAHDIIEEYTPWLSNKVNHTYPNHHRQMDEHLTTSEMTIVDILDHNDRSFDELLGQTGWDFGHLHSVLLSLIIKKQIIQLSGSLYKRI
ncbi:DNA-processing protein DprA [Paenibacillus sediminis]|uniref:DNA processing protein n=1 Tax=Paenibacillus sediminis TaxID=664909 RepID=A0ABS4H1M9_9BACL|nr:DNA-processing protein DprA [Paenibacillus sediminis]MBP1936436.1 DNA processing protein [Paenibacillus sediminis]